MKLGGGFGTGLLQGQRAVQGAYDTYRQAQKDREAAEQKKAFEEIAKATPESSQGFTADQGGELEKLAGQGYEIGYDQGQNAYVAKNAAGDAKQIAMQGVTDFMGQRKVGAMSQADTDNARMLAMADVVGKNDPFKGMQFRKEVRDAQYQDKRQGREEKQWAREDSIDAIDKQLGEEMDKGLVGADGQRRAPTANDFLTQSQNRIAKLQQAGYSKEAGAAYKDYHAASFSKLELESKEREAEATKVLARIESGDLNAFGEYANKFLPTGSTVTGVTRGEDGNISVSRTGLDGKELPPLSIGNMEALKNTVLGSVSTKYAYDISGRVFSQDQERQNLALKQKGQDLQERQFGETVRHNRNQEARAARLNGSGGGGSGGGGAAGGAQASFNPLAGWDEKEAMKAATSVVDKQKDAMNGKPMSAKERADTIQANYAAMRDAYAAEQGNYQRMNFLAAMAREAKTPEQKEQLRQEALNRNYTPEQINQYLPAPKAAAPAQAAAQGPAPSRAPTPAPAQPKEPARVDPVVDSAAGKRVDAAKHETAKAQEEARKYGIRQRAQDPSGYEKAMARLNKAKAEAVDAERQWTSEVAKTGIGAYFGGR